MSTSSFVCYRYIYRGFRKRENAELDRMMPNITLSVEKDVIKKVRKIAIDRDTTLTAMVRDFLRSVASRDMQDHSSNILLNDI